MEAQEQAIDKLNAEIETLRALVHGATDDMPIGKMRAAQARISAAQHERAAAIAQGCSVCPTCKAPPIGMPQSVAINRRPVFGFEIGCATCKDHRAFGLDLQSAHRAWERGPNHPQGWRAPESVAAEERSDRGENLITTKR